MKKHTLSTHRTGKKIHFTKHHKTRPFSRKKSTSTEKFGQQKTIFGKKPYSKIPPRISYYYAKSLMIQKLLCCEKFIKTVNQNYPPTIHYFCSFRKKTHVMCSIIFSQKLLKFYVHTFSFHLSLNLVFTLFHY